MAKKVESTHVDRAGNPTVQITFRIPEEWLGRGDDISKRLSREGVMILSRTDVFRAAMLAGFEKLERKEKR